MLRRQTRRLRLPIAGRAGANDVLIADNHWNHGTVTFAETDVRPVALLSAV